MILRLLKALIYKKNTIKVSNGILFDKKFYV